MMIISVLLFDFHFRSKRLASGALEHILRLSEREARVENAVVIFPQGKSRAYPFSGSHIICFKCFKVSHMSQLEDLNRDCV